MKTWLKAVICCALVVGCSSPETREVGTVSMALTTTSGSTTYRLMGATFTLTGPESQSVTPAPGDERFQVDLAAGDYTIALQSGWHMESSVDGGPFVAVNAVLDSPATQAFSIYADEITHVRYRFRAGPDVMEFGDGRLDLGIEVDGPNDQPCVVSNATCSSNIVCAGHTATIENSCQFSTGPDGTTITCDGAATTFPSGFGVATNGYGDAARQLADLQRRLLEYYESHGLFPVATAPFTPAATCCGAGGVFECTAYVGAWQGTAAWDALAFSIATDHSFVFSYTSASGADAVVTARGDLDCDAVAIDLTLSCSVTNGDPSCTLSMPTQCDGSFPD